MGNYISNKLIWCNGTFDILHPGHIELFKTAKNLGDKLIVATDSDEKIRKDKGEHRPMNDLCSRIAMLSAIKYIDDVLFFNDRKHLEDLIKVVVGDRNQPSLAVAVNNQLVQKSKWKKKIIKEGDIIEIVYPFFGG